MTWFSFLSLSTEPLKNILWFLENPSHGERLVNALYNLPVEVCGNNGIAPHLIIKETTYGGVKKIEIMPQQGYSPISIRSGENLIEQEAYEQKSDGYLFRIMSSRLNGSGQL